MRTHAVAAQTFDVTALGSDTATADASCPAGTVPIGGGYTDGSGNGGGNFSAFSTLVNGPLFNRDVNNAIIGGDGAST